MQSHGGELAHSPQRNHTKGAFYTGNQSRWAFLRSPGCSASNLDLMQVGIFFFSSLFSFPTFLGGGGGWNVPFLEVRVIGAVMKGKPHNHQKHTHTHTDVPSQTKLSASSDSEIHRPPHPPTPVSSGERCEFFLTLEYKYL